MAIERIGPPAIGTTGGVGGTAPLAGPTRDFRTHLAQPSVSEASASATPLARLHAGEIGVEQYGDLKIAEATAHLRGLPPSVLAKIEATLRERLDADPAIAGTVSAAAARWA